MIGFTHKYKARIEALEATVEKQRCLIDQLLSNQKKVLMHTERLDDAIKRREAAQAGLNQIRQAGPVSYMHSAVLVEGEK